MSSLSSCLTFQTLEKQFLPDIFHNSLKKLLHSDMQDNKNCTRYCRSYKDRNVLFLHNLLIFPILLDLSLDYEQTLVRWRLAQISNKKSEVIELCMYFFWTSLNVPKVEPSSNEVFGSINSASLQGVHNNEELRQIQFQRETIQQAINIEILTSTKKLSCSILSCSYSVMT